MAQMSLYITKNGYGDMVIMSMEVYEQMMRKITDIKMRREDI